MKEANVQKNTIYSIIKSVAAIIFPLISFPYASRVLLTEGVGRVNFGNSIISYCTLVATLGITSYAIRECARVRNNREELSKVASQLFTINMVTTAIAYVFLAMALVFVDALADYRVLIIVQSTNVIFATLGAEWLNSALEDFKFITLRTVAFQVLALVAMFAFVRTSEDYLIYALIGVLSSSGSNIVNMFYRRRFCTIRLVKEMNLKRHLPPILLMFSMVLSQTIYVNSGVTMIGLFRGDHEVGLYSTATKIYTIVNTLVASVAFVVMPKISYHYAKEEYDQINDLLRYGLGFIVTLGLPCLVGLNVLCKDIIHAIAGEAYFGAIPALHVLTISLAFSFLGGFIGNLILIPTGKEAICLRTSIISSLVSLVLNLILIPRIGFVAAPITTSVAEMIGFIIASRHVYKWVDLGKLSKLLLAPLLGCAAIVFVVLAIRNFIDDNLVRVVVSVAASVVAYLVVLILLEHEFTLNLIKKLKK